MAPQKSLPPLQASDFTSAFPKSRKVYVEGRGVRVPMREITLSGGEPPLRVYDTSGPQGFDVREGLPTLRRDWIGGSRPRPVGVEGHLRGHPASPRTPR
jgi:hypothetical protein